MSSTTPTPPLSLYPSFAPSYGGTIGDILAKEHTALYLSNIRQNQATIDGFFNGLGLTGPFTGSVTPSGHVQFTVIIQDGNAMLVFAGDIKVGGDIVGSYQVQNKRGQHIGDTGVWNLAANT